MPDSYWFPSILIDVEGHWRGRFLRSNATDCGRDAAIAWLVQAIADDAESSAVAGLCFVPTSVLTEAVPLPLLAWAPADAPCIGLADSHANGTTTQYAAWSASTQTPMSATATPVLLDTGARPGWQFPAGGGFADIGHLQHRKAPQTAEADRAKPQLLQLLTLITRDAETRELEKAFRADPELAYHLLRLVNSVGMGLSHQVKSLSHAITVVGRRQLQRWLQLLIYVNTKAERGKANPLLQLAAYRGRLLELLASPGKDPDSAYIVGIFSLLDRILPGKISELLAKLPIQPAIRDALCHRNGYLGKLLTACEAAEAGNFELAATELAALDIEPLRWLRSQTIAYDWAHAIGRELARPAST